VHRETRRVLRATTARTLGTASVERLLDPYDESSLWGRRGTRAARLGVAFGGDDWPLADASVGGRRRPTDYGHDLQFGYFLIPDAGDPDGVLETAHLERIRVFQDVVEAAARSLTDTHGDGARRRIIDGLQDLRARRCAASTTS
jgi:hypothetical protein